MQNKERKLAFQVMCFLPQYQQRDLQAFLSLHFTKQPSGCCDRLIDQKVQHRFSGTETWNFTIPEKLVSCEISVAGYIRLYNRSQWDLLGEELPQKYTSFTLRPCSATECRLERK